LRLTCAREPEVSTAIVLETHIRRNQHHHHYHHHHGQQLRFSSNMAHSCPSWWRAWSFLSNGPNCRISWKSAQRFSNCHEEGVTHSAVTWRTVLATSRCQNSALYTIFVVFSAVAQLVWVRTLKYLPKFISIYISLLSVIHTIYSIMQNYKPGATCFDRLWSSSGPIFWTSPSHL